MGVDINNTVAHHLRSQWSLTRGKSSRRDASLGWQARKDILGPLRRGCVGGEPGRRGPDLAAFEDDEGDSGGRGLAGGPWQACGAQKKRGRPWKSRAWCDAPPGTQQDEVGLSLHSVDRADATG